jgi:bifunctional DNase/RNase
MRGLGAVFATVALLTCAGAALGQGLDPNAIPARVVGVFESSAGPVIILEAVGRQAYLPVWVADREATVARDYLAGQRQPRPLTHDLLLNVITSLGARVTQVFVSDLRDRTFIGRIDVFQGGLVRQIDARTSDAVCIALGARVPVFIMAHVLAQAGMTRGQLAQQGIVLPP